MRNLFRRFRDNRFSYEPLVRVEISREALLNNLKIFAAYVGDWKLAPVLKSNAYGHGLVEVASIVDKHSAVAFLVVDSYYEALILRNERIQAPILIIGYSLSENLLTSRLKDIAWTIASLSQLETLVKTVSKTVHIHIKFDTGMHRQGILPHHLEMVIELVKSNSYLVVEGICSHLASADDPEETGTYEQIKIWNAIVSVWKKEFTKTKYYHVSPTAGARFCKDIEANVGRLGLGLYGIDQGGTLQHNLQPVLQMKTYLASVKEVAEGALVGYGGTFRAPQDMVIATVPVGYAEGVDRQLSNTGSVIVGGVVCPIIGRVSMNITTIDVSHIPQPQEGDEVVIISNKNDAPNSILNWARLCKTIPYVLFVHIPDRLRRQII